ncbi:hypothetical protein [Pseudomonas peli]|uniref:hypothetical protein n=1 Tax=Pseudomonas peli TaxID=592361 RepID=UPI003D313B82
MSNGMFWCRLVALFLGVVSPALFAAEGPQVYSGMLGKMAIVVELDLRDPEQVIGRYFYRKHHHDLALRGRLQGQQLSLVEGRDRYDDAPRPELRLQRSPQGWQGEWVGPQGKKLAVKLTQPTIEEPPAGAEPFWYRLYEESPYEFLRLKELPLKPGKRQDFMGHELQWWTEAVSGLRMFEVLSGYPQAQLDLINQQLRARLREEVIDYHACKLGAGDPRAEFLQTVRPRLLSAHVVSLSIFTSYDCGGAHPDFSDAPLTLDADTGKPLGLEDLLWVGEGPAFHYLETREHKPDEESVSFDVFSQYRNRYFAPWLVEQWRQIAPDELPEPADDLECNYSDPEIWDFPSWYLNEKGIVLDSIFPRVARACEETEWSVLPYAVVKKHPGRLRLALPD